MKNDITAPHEQLNFETLPYIPDAYLRAEDMRLDADDELRMSTIDDDTGDPVGLYFGSRNRAAQAGIIAQEKAALRIHATMPFTFDALVAGEQIRPVTVNTPLESGNDMFPEADYPIWFKREDMQLNGAFKTRGSAKTLVDLTEEQREAGVVLASAGNAAAGLAGAARSWGVPVKVVMSEQASELKAENCRRKGAEVIRYGTDYDEAAAYAAYIVSQNAGMVLGQAFENESVMTGQSTHMTEILAEQPDIHHAFLAGGGGGLAAKSAAVLHELNPFARVICAQLKGADALRLSWLAGHPVKLDSVDQWSDGTAVALPGQRTVTYARQHVDEFSVVSRIEAALEMRRFREFRGCLIEPPPALALAALRRYVPLLRGPAVVTISGGNISQEDWDSKTAPARQMAIAA